VTRANEPLFDLLDEAGRLLLADSTHSVACLVADRLHDIPGWSAGLRIRSQRLGPVPNGLLWDWRHEGPLELLACAVHSGSGHALVLSHVGRCGMQIEEAARRLEQFEAPDQAKIVAAMAEHFGFDPLVWTAHEQGESL